MHIKILYTAQSSGQIKEIIKCRQVYDTFLYVFLVVHYLSPSYQYLKKMLNMAAMLLLYILNKHYLTKPFLKILFPLSF
jgi:hypothetical protein